MNKKPRQPRERRQDGWIAFQVRVPPEIHAKLEARAEAAHGSVNQQVVLLLEQGLNEGDDNA